ncbi:hypothetical protein QYE76_011781, partial [Lolium multiflorum]
CTLRGEALVKFDFLMDSLKENDESIEELEYHLNDKERRFNLLRQELKTERCISQGLKQQIETYELDKVKDLETIERAQSLTQELNASKEELEVAHASLTRDLDHLERANKLVKDELKKLGKNHDLLQETYSKALESMNDSIENVRLKKELAKFTTTKSKMGLDDLLSKQRSNNQKYGLGYVPKPYKKNNYKKEKPAQEKNKKGYSSGGPKWVFDSGCTNHMTGGRGVLDQFIEDINKKSSITFGDNSKGKVLGYGKVAISKDLCLETVMLVEHLGYNLLSIYHLADAGYNSYFTKYYVQVFRSDNLKLVLVGYVENNLYVVDLSKESPSLSTCLMAAKHDEGWLWHRRLGHVNMRNLKQLLKGEHIVGLTGISFEKDRVCSACVAGKQLKKKHPIKSIITTSRPLELLHLDLFGPSHYDTLGGSKYGLVIVDDYSRYSWVFLLKSKDETHREFITFAKKAQRTYESEIKAIRTDNGTEFKNYTMQEFVDDEGIKHEFSAPYTPQQNGVVERKNRTIIEMARTMLSEFNSPHNFWGEAISTAVHYSNRLFLRPLHNKTPYELLTGNKPNVTYIRVFGCKCLVKNNKGKLGKFEIRTIEGIFVGYAENSHAYRYYNRSTGAIEVSCDVVFLEDNGSQVEQVVPCVAGNDDDPSSAIKHMGIGHIRPMEVHNDDQDDGIEVSSTAQVEPSSTQAEPSNTTQEPSSTQDESHSEEQEEGPHSTEQDHDDDQETSSTHDQAQVIPHDQALVRDEFIDHEGTIRKIKAATRASDMKVDQVLGSISRGVELRTVNLYRFDQRTYTQGDKFFWTMTQAVLWNGYYDSHEFMKNGDIVSPKAINPDELALHEATKYRFVVETLKAMGCGGDSAPGYKIHSRSKLTKGDISFCYPANPIPGPPTISGMYYSYLVLAKMFRENLIASRDTSEVRNYHLNQMYYCHPDRVRKIDGCDLIHCELKRAVMDRMTPNYAQYVQRLINYNVPAPLNTLGEKVIMDPFKIPTQEATRPDVPSMMPITERQERHDHDASSSYSRRPKHGAARFFSSMWQMCKNTSDVAHHSLTVNQETRRRQNEFMAPRNHPVPPSGPEMEPVVAPQWEMPLLTDEMIQNFDFSMYAHGSLPPRTARAPTPPGDGGDEDEGDAASRDEGASSYSSGHEFY